MKNILVLLIGLAMLCNFAYAEEELADELEDQTFWTQEIDYREEWGTWLKEVYKPYSDKMTVAMLKIVASTAEIDFTGKSSEEILEEVNAAYNRSLRSMELIKPPAEFRAYHSKVVALYRQTIDADPKEEEQNALERKQLSQETDEAMTRALKLNRVPQKIINYINRN